MLAALFGPRRGVLCVLTYLAEGLAGLPVFAGGLAAAAFAGPTAGYLLGFAPAAYLTGRLAQKGWDRNIHSTVLTMLLGNLVIYACGLAWLTILLGFKKALITGVYPFLIGDAFKIALAAALLPGAWKLLNKLEKPAT
jgi:biotin transport system substrate-specific component